MTDPNLWGKIGLRWGDADLDVAATNQKIHRIIDSQAHRLTDTLQSRRSERSSGCAVGQWPGPPQEGRARWTELQPENVTNSNCLSRMLMFRRRSKLGTVEMSLVQVPRKSVVRSGRTRGGPVESTSLRREAPARRNLFGNHQHIKPNARQQEIWCRGSISPGVLWCSGAIINKNRDIDKHLQ
ncbi:hypothetical protein B7463_g1091, partial [Scytalidium lignicola]